MVLLGGAVGLWGRTLPAEGEDDDVTVARGRAWLQELREAATVDLAEQVGFRGARDSASANAVIVELLAQKDLLVDPVRIAVRVDGLDLAALLKGVDHAVMRRAVRALGPCTPQQQKEVLGARIAADESVATALAGVAVFVWQVVPEPARRAVETRLVEGPLDIDALVPLIAEPALWRTPKIAARLTAAAGASSDPLLIGAAALVDGRRDDAADRLLAIASDPDAGREDVLHAITMLSILGPEGRMREILHVAKQHPSLAWGIYRCLWPAPVPESLYVDLKAMATGTDAGASMACQMLYVEAPVRGDLFPSLLSLAESTQRDVRELVAVGLGRYAQRGFACGGGIVQLLGAENAWPVRWSALTAASRVGPYEWSVRDHVLRMAKAGDRSAVYAMQVLVVWGDREARTIMRAHVEKGGAIGIVPELAACEEWDEILELCRRRTAAGDVDSRASVLVASLDRATDSKELASYADEWRALPNSAALAAARRWYECGGDVLPGVVSDDIRRRLWAWGDSPVSDVGNRLFAIGALESSGVMKGVEYRDAVMRMLGILLDEEVAGAYMESWHQLARRIEWPLLPIWYLTRMSRDPSVSAPVRSACRALVEGR
jgi:hypothetical protein